MKQYHRLLRHILKRGEDTDDRTGVGTRFVFGYQMRFNLNNGSLPLLTTKKLPFRIIAEELLWFLRGDTQLRPLLLAGVHIWDDWPYKNYLISEQLPVPNSDSPEWESGIKEFTDRIVTDDEFAAKYGNLGPVYGRQWRQWKTEDGRVIDQIQDVLDLLRTSPNSRRIIVCAWNPGDTAEMAIAGLPPCHCLFQFKAHKGKLSCQSYQRSCDTFLGVPFNIASYALLTIMIAHVTGLTPHEFVWTGGDVHLYKNHFRQARKQLRRKPKQLPTVSIRSDATDLFTLTYSDLKLVGYDPDPAIPAPIAV